MAARKSIITEADIGPLTRADLDVCADIELAAFPHGQSWDKSFLRDFHKSKSYSMTGVFIKKRLVGFIIHEATDSAIHILRMAVHPDWQRQRFGTVMITQLCHMLSPQAHRELVIDVPDYLLGAQLMLKSCDFIAAPITHEQGVHRLEYRMVLSPWGGKITGKFVPTNRISSHFPDKSCS